MPPAASLASSASAPPGSAPSDSDALAPASLSGSLPAPRSHAQLQAHYAVEVELADRLRHASRLERRRLYGSLYDELFRRVPDHPQLTAAPPDRREEVASQLRLLEPFLDRAATVIEIGPGDCALSRALCTRVQRVIGVDVSDEITRRADLPANFMLRLSDGVSVPGPARGVELVYSHQLMEHLHPDDAVDQLGHIVERLKPGGVYLCVTPSRLTGPHDISRFFSPTAKGFHLREYSAGELLALFRAAGFREVELVARVRGQLRRLPEAWVLRAEQMMEAAPRWARQSLRRLPPWRWIDTLCIVGRKSA